VVGTAGHIDHGKTALVYALTGTDTDRLPEEKRRGITIDLGFASLRLPDGRGHMLDLSIVDVPGHHAFVRNMLAGAAGIDCAMLVIAADEGIKPQTEEHLAICSLLGIRSGVVALTKSDTVDAERLRDVCASARDFLRHSFLDGAPIVSTSARTGEGIDRLRDAIFDTLAPRGSLEMQGGFITSVRQESLLREALLMLEKARDAAEAGIPHELLMLDLYCALHPIDAITGATTADDIINQIFTTFCIGK